MPTTEKRILRAKENLGGFSRSYRAGLGFHAHARRNKLTLRSDPSASARAASSSSSDEVGGLEVAMSSVVPPLDDLSPGMVSLLTI